MKRCRALDPDAGFTLVETLIAVFVLAIMMSAGGSMLLTSFDGQRLISTRGERLATLDVAQSYLTRDLLAATPRVFEPIGAFGRDVSFRGGPADRDGMILSFVRGGWSNFEGAATRSNLAVIEYRFEEGTLVRRVQTRPDALRATPVFAEPLVAHLQGVEVRFFADGREAERWDTIFLAGRPVLPDAVGLTFTFENGETLDQIYLIGGRP